MQLMEVNERYLQDMNRRCGALLKMTVLLFFASAARSPNRFTQRLGSTEISRANTVGNRVDIMRNNLTRHFNQQFYPRNSKEIKDGDPFASDQCILDAHEHQRRNRDQ